MKEGAERIISRILEDAEAKSRAIMAEVSDKTAELDKAAKESASRQAEKIVEQARKEAVESRRRILGIAELEARKEVLAAKQDLIAAVFDRSLDELLASDDQDYLALMQRMLLESVISGREEVVLSAADQKRIPAVFWKELNELLKKKGKEGNLAPSTEPREIRGGFVLLAEGVEINCTFESLFKMLRDELEPEVASVLFK
jgi:V/A-type H+-transporting ATPase subunit E